MPNLKAGISIYCSSAKLPALSCELHLHELRAWRSLHKVSPSSTWTMACQAVTLYWNSNGPELMVVSVEQWGSQMKALTQKTSLNVRVGRTWSASLMARKV